MQPDQILITDPKAMSLVPVDQEFEVGAAQQIPAGGPTQGAVTLQFSSSSMGPFVAARGMGGGGAVECDAQPWSAQDATFVLPRAKLALGTSAVHVRLAVYDGFLDGEPVGSALYVGPALKWRTAGSQNAGSNAITDTRDGGSTVATAPTASGE